MTNDSPLAEQVLSKLELDVRATFRMCIQKAPRAADDLRSELIRYKRDMEHLAERSDISDRDLAEELVDRCQKLLDKASAEPNSEAAKLAAGAIRYVTTIDDARSDAMSIVGLEDDLAVVRAVEAVLTNANS